MIVQRGKAAGWLHIDLGALKLWASSAGIDFKHALPEVEPGKGTVLVAKRDIAPGEEDERELLTIAASLVLSRDTVKHHAQFDQDFREVLEALGDFGLTPRGSILPFLLFHASYSDPTLTEKFGVRTEFTSYVKSLPCELLPTFWTTEELQLLKGTTLAPAVSAKLHSLQREYDNVVDLVSNTRWFGIVQHVIDLDDWLQVDAMFRSRALDFHGSCMIPGMDLASHAAGARTNATYDRHEETYSLYAKADAPIAQNEEVTISYGDEKGACEMIFSYGFLDAHMNSAETLFLSLAIPPEDAMRRVKLTAAQCAPGFKITEIKPDLEGGDNLPSDTSIWTEWEGDFVWLLCVDESDGLEAQIAVDVHGEQELEMTFHSQAVPDGAAGLRVLLERSKLWDVYRLRAVVILQQRVFEQLEILDSSQGKAEATLHGGGTAVRSGPFQTAMQLRALEFDLLNKAYEDFERQKIALADSPVVAMYLQQTNGEYEDDFS